MNVIAKKNPSDLCEVVSSLIVLNISLNFR